MKTYSEDRRVRRTHRLIEEALLKLMMKKPVQKITVSELAKEADITRSTFYQYYNDPMEVLENLRQSIIEDVQQVIEETEGGDAYGFFLTLFRYFGADETKSRILEVDTGFGSGYELIGNTIHEGYMLRWGEKFTGDKVKQYEYYRYYIVFGCIAVIRNWIRNGKQETPEQMASIASSLLPKEKMYLKPDKN